MRRALAEARRKAHAPGLAMAVVRPDGLAYADGVGYADLAGGTAVTPDTAFLWFSMTKVVTATAALRLGDEGRLDLDAPLSLYGSHLRVRSDDRATLRQVLAHSAGFANPLPLRWVHPAGSIGPDADELLRRLLARRGIVRREAGGPGRYSNVGYLVAADIIATASGVPFERYVEEAILEPLGMTNTGFRYPDGVPAATGYVRMPRVLTPILDAAMPPGIVGERHGAYTAFRPFLVDGAGYGGLVGTVRDAGRFLRMHLNDGELDGARVLDPGTARGMRRIVSPGKPFDHATGWFRRPEGGRTDYVEHFGAGAGFWNAMRLYPDRGVGGVAMTNGTTPFDCSTLFGEVVGTFAP
jgi:CubicO group peptidase (beta-lactamase class C family)